MTSYFKIKAHTERGPLILSFDNEGEARLFGIYAREKGYRTEDYGHGYQLLRDHAQALNILETFGDPA